MNNKQKKEINKVFMDLAKFKKQPKWEEHYESMLDEVYEFISLSSDLSYQEIDALIHDSGDQFITDNIEAFLLEEGVLRSYEDTGKTIVDYYLKQKGWKHSAFAQRYLRNFNKSVFDIWEVVDVAQGNFIDIVAYGKEGETKRVYDEAFSSYLTQGRCIGARLMEHDGDYYFCDSFCPIPREYAHSITTHRDNFISSMSDDLSTPNKLPTEDYSKETMNELLLRSSSMVCWIHVFAGFLINSGEKSETQSILNKDGDDFELIKLRFSIEKEVVSEITDILNTTDDMIRIKDLNHWIWIDSSSEHHKKDEEYSILGHLELSNKALTIDVNSRQRAEKSETFFRSILGDTLGLRARSSKFYTYPSP